MCFASLLLSGVDRRGIKMSVYNYTALENKFVIAHGPASQKGKHNIYSGAETMKNSRTFIQHSHDLVHPTEIEVT